MTEERICVKQFLRGFNHKPLKVEEETKLLKKAKRGSQEARHRLIESNQRFIVRMALSYRNQGLSIGDLIQEGNLGLIEAIDRYDPEKSCRLVSYAAWWIRLFMQRAIEQRSRTVTIPVNKISILKQILNFEYNFVKTRGRKPTYQEIAEAIDRPEDKVRYVYHLGTTTVSIHAEDDDGQSMENRLTQDDSEPLRHRLWQDELRQKMNQAFKLLSPRERDVLRCRYGIGEGRIEPEAASLRQTGRKLGLSAEGVRQIQAQALAKLKDPEFGAGLNSFI